MNQELKKSIILENYQYPKNRGLLNDESYIKVNTKSKSCIDQLDIQMKIENDIVKDIRFDGEACAICTSSTSIMINTLIGKSLNEALDIIKNFMNMIEEKEYDSNILGEAIVYDDIYKQPNRKKCATLSWEGSKCIIEKSNK